MAEYKETYKCSCGQTVPASLKCTKCYSGTHCNACKKRMEGEPRPGAEVYHMNCLTTENES